MTPGLARAVAAGVLVLGSSLAGGSAIAHHAFASEYDGAAPVLLKGEITKVDWLDPHTRLHLKVSEIEYWSGAPAQPVKTVKSGPDSERWVVEVARAGSVRLNGLDERTLLPGDLVTVRGYQAKNRDCASECKANGRDLTFADGSKLTLSGTSAASQAAGDAFKDKRLGREASTTALC